jgi:hypothetical protein
MLIGTNPAVVIQYLTLDRAVVILPADSLAATVPGQMLEDVALIVVLEDALSTGGPPTRGSLASEWFGETHVPTSLIEPATTSSRIRRRQEAPAVVDLLTMHMCRRSGSPSSFPGRRTLVIRKSRDRGPREGQGNLPPSASGPTGTSSPASSASDASARDPRHRPTPSCRGRDRSCSPRRVKRGQPSRGAVAAHSYSRSTASGTHTVARQPLGDVREHYWGWRGSGLSRRAGGGGRLQR